MLLGLSDAKPSAETAESTNHYLEKLLFASVGVPLVLQYFAIVTAADQFALTSTFFSLIPRCCFVSVMWRHIPLQNGLNYCLSFVKGEGGMKEPLPFWNYSSVTPPRRSNHNSDYLEIIFKNANKKTLSIPTLPRFLISMGL